MMMKTSLFIATLLVGVITAQDELEFGADMSFPMQHEHVSSNFAWLPHK
jgi:hypothetical protein